MWGNFFYNVSYAVSEITGCKLSSKGSFITVLGKANSKPVVMLLNKNDGSINKFWTIEHIAVAAVAPTYTTLAGVLYEESESGVDNLPYLYAAFNKDNDMHIVKIKNTSPPEVNWHYYNPSATAN